MRFLQYSDTMDAEDILWSEEYFEINEPVSFTKDREMLYTSTGTQKGNRNKLKKQKS